MITADIDHDFTIENKIESGEIETWQDLGVALVDRFNFYTDGTARQEFQTYVIGKLQEAYSKERQPLLTAAEEVTAIIRSGIQKGTKASYFDKLGRRIRNQTRKLHTVSSPDSEPAQGLDGLPQIGYYAKL